MEKKPEPLGACRWEQPASERFIPLDQALIGTAGRAGPSSLGTGRAWGREGEWEEVKDGRIEQKEGREGLKIEQAD